MSCYDDFSYIQSALQHNAVSYLLKPLDENKILEALNNAIDRIKNKKEMYKKYTGKTILDYITSLRMDEAKRLLSKPSIRISDVAESIGYKSISHFRSIFKEYTGVDVSDFRTKAIEREKSNDTKP